MTTKITILKVATALVVAGAVAVTTASAASAHGGSQHLEASALAVPATPGATAEADVMRLPNTDMRTAMAGAVATTSLTCDGCTGHAATLQVVYARRARAITADNVATAWATCTGCQGWALSLQVVLARRAGDVTAANRAFAANSACDSCDTSAVAVQIVVISPSARRLGGSALAQIIALEQQLEAQLADPGAVPQPSAATQPAAVTPQTPGRATPQAAARPAAKGSAAKAAVPAGRSASATDPVTAATDSMQAALEANLDATSSASIQVSNG